MSTGTSVADVQKINKELEKLQLSDEESVFEEAVVSPDARYRCHQKASLHDADLPVFGSIGQSSASLLSPRSIIPEGCHMVGSAMGHSRREDGQN